MPIVFDDGLGRFLAMLICTVISFATGSDGDHGLVQPQGAGLAHLNTQEDDFCVAVLNEANQHFGPPEIMNTDSHTIDASSRVV